MPSFSPSVRRCIRPLPVLRSRHGHLHLELVSFRARLNLHGADLKRLGRRGRRWREQQRQHQQPRCWQSAQAVHPARLSRWANPVSRSSCRSATSSSPAWTRNVRSGAGHGATSRAPRSVDGTMRLSKPPSCNPYRTAPGRPGRHRRLPPGRAEDHAEQPGSPQEVAPPQRVPRVPLQAGCSTRSTSGRSASQRASASPVSI